MLPYLRELGERWERGDASIGQEHFATGILRGRLLGLARGWGARARGPHALLACAPGEHHELGLIAFGLGLRDRYWRITYLGPDTPLDTVAEIAEVAAPGRGGDRNDHRGSPGRASGRRSSGSDAPSRSGSQVRAPIASSPRQWMRRCSTSIRSQRQSA